MGISFSSFFAAGINHFHKTPDREWFETDAVLRVSLGNFLFFTILAVIMAGIKDQKDPRDKIHHGGWMAKIFCWAVIVFLMFFVPNGVVSFYGERPSVRLFYLSDRLVTLG
jgi:Na+/proline symporter